MPDVDVLAETERIKRNWRLRDAQMLLDRDMLNLVKPIPKTDKVQWVSNEPKVLYETACALVSSYPPRFRIPLSINFTQEEKKKINKAERLVLGIFRNLDRRQMNRGQNYWLREFAYWVLSGWSTVFSMVKRNGDNVDFIADIWDPITVYPEWDANGLVKCVRSFEADWSVIQTLLTSWKTKGWQIDFNKPEEVTKIKVANFWLNDRGKIYNSIWIHGQEIKPLTLEKQFDAIPIFVNAVGVPETTSADFVTRRGENFISQNRDIFEYTNQMISLMATIMAETAYPNIVSQTITGAPPAKTEQMKGYGEWISTKIGEKIELLKHAATPAEVGILLNWASKQGQKGGLSDIVYGGVPAQEFSGFAISQLLAALRYKMAPYLVTAQYTMGAIGANFLELYRKGDEQGDFPKITLNTTNPKEMRKGLFFVEDFKPSDVPETCFVEVSIPITSAMDKTQQIIFARQALTAPQLISRETLWDEILDIQDSEQEYARILQDETLELPIVKQIMMLEQLKLRVEGYKNQGKIVEANALNQYIMMLEMQMGMRKGIPEVPGEAGGVPPNFMPPEMMQSPDMARAAMGAPPPGLERRAQTPEERAESKGKVGRLVSPSGEYLT